MFAYTITDYKLIDVIDTELNPNGVLAISYGHDSRVIACPHTQVGYARVQLYGTFWREHGVDKKKTNIMRTNKKAVVCMALNYSGSLLATASKSGTTIKVYSTLSAQLLQEVRRGAKRADILHITFHRSSKFLACTSSKDAVHIFELFDAIKFIDESEYKGYMEKTPADEVGYTDDTITLDPTAKNKTAKYGLSGESNIGWPCWGRCSRTISSHTGVWQS